jgi:hypothetical protein
LTCLEYEGNDLVPLAAVKGVPVNVYLAVRRYRFKSAGATIEGWSLIADRIEVKGGKPPQLGMTLGGAPCIENIFSSSRY